MSTYVILLRGVNVGKAKRVPMAELKLVLAEIGCTRATTLLNSGNAVVAHPKISSAALAAKVGAAISARFGFEVPVVVQTCDDLGAVVAANQLEVDEADHPRLLVAFAQSKTSIATLAPLAGLISPEERFVLTDHAAFLYCAGGILQSKAGDALLGKFGKAVTTRNWATVLKLHALTNQGAD